jgi:hypothetical protein
MSGVQEAGGRVHVSPAVTSGRSTEEPMDTLLRDFHELDWPNAITREVPTGIFVHQPPRAEPGAEHIWPEVSGTEEPTYLHPGAIIGAASGYAGFLLVSWMVFAGHGYMGLTLAVATMISGVMLGLMAGGGAGGRNTTPWQRPWRSFREFLGGKVEVWGGQIPGREAFIQLTAMAWCLTLLAVVFGVIVEAVRP